MNPYAYAGQMIGALIPTLLISRLLLKILKKWDAGINKLIFVHCLSLLACAFLAGIGMADGGAFVPIQGALTYALPQFVWFLFDVRNSRKNLSLSES
jgi:hypothetical protein